MLALNIPYFALLVLIIWWLIDKWRAKPVVASPPV
jgi:hypothetical protein